MSALGQWYTSDRNGFNSMLLILLLFFSKTAFSHATCWCEIGFGRLAACLFSFFCQRSAVAFNSIRCDMMWRQLDNPFRRKPAKTRTTKGSLHFIQNRNRTRQQSGTSACWRHRREFLTGDVTSGVSDFTQLVAAATAKRPLLFPWRTQNPFHPGDFSRILPNQEA